MKKIIITILLSAFIFLFSILCIFAPSDVYSESERRELAPFPKYSKESLLSGDFVRNFELYANERFPYRDIFRSIKAMFSTRILHKSDNNGLFVADGHISKLDSVENPKMMDHAAEKFLFLYNSYMKDKNLDVYFSIVPDKNFVLAEKNGYPSLDYDDFIEKMKNKTEYMKYIDIIPLLSLEDYYTTDSHWRQEAIVDIAEKLATEMGASVKADYVVHQLENPFYGVYYGQMAMPFSPDTIKYLTNDTIDNSIVTYYDTGKPKSGEMYNMEKAFGKDPYEMFLSGTTPLVTIENPTAEGKGELVIFRDSFGGSLAPLMSSGYKKITLVDIRYIQSAYVGSLVNFDDCDVLFIYSTTLLNNSLAMK